MNTNVYIEIRTGDVLWSLITSREAAEAFVCEWQMVDGQQVIEISGEGSDRDRRPATAYVQKSEIVGVWIQEIGNY